MVIEIDITVHEQSRKHSFDLSMQNAHDTSVTPKKMAISLPKLPHIFGITVRGLLQRVLLGILRNDIGVASTIGAVSASANAGYLQCDVGILSDIDGVGSVASEVVVSPVFIDDSVHECATSFATLKNNGPSIVLGSAAQIMLGRYRTLADMDDELLSAFDDMDLSDIDFITI